MITSGREADVANLLARRNIDARGIQGKAEQAQGRLQQAQGDLTCHESKKAEGMLDEAKGKICKGIDKAREMIHEKTHDDNFPAAIRAHCRSVATRARSVSAGSFAPTATSWTCIGSCTKVWTIT